MGDVAIFELDRGFSIFVWLCPRHVAARKKAGWDVKTRKKAPHALTCDDCPKEEERSP